MTDLLQVSTTTDTRDAAVALARSAVKARLAASAQITGPVTSLYWHQGEYGEGEEWQVLLTTTSTRYPELEQHLIENHRWDNPQVTAAPLTAGSPNYLAWVRDTTAGG